MSCTYIHIYINFETKQVNVLAFNAFFSLDARWRKKRCRKQNHLSTLNTSLVNDNWIFYDFLRAFFAWFFALLLLMLKSDMYLRFSARYSAISGDYCSFNIWTHKDWSDRSKTIGFFMFWAVSKSICNYIFAILKSNGINLISVFGDAKNRPLAILSTNFNELISIFFLSSRILSFQVGFSSMKLPTKRWTPINRF